MCRREDIWERYVGQKQNRGEQATGKLGPRLKDWQCGLFNSTSGYPRGDTVGLLSLQVLQLWPQYQMSAYDREKRGFIILLRMVAVFDGFCQAVRNQNGFRWRGFVLLASPTSLFFSSDNSILRVKWDRPHSQAPGVGMWPSPDSERVPSPTSQWLTQDGHVTLQFNNLQLKSWTFIGKEKLLFFWTCS